MEIAEERLSAKLSGELIALSRDWEGEDSCRGYRENGPEDLAGNRIFTAREDGALRPEGREYEMKDGDVVEFMFN